LTGIIEHLEISDETFTYGERIVESSEVLAKEAVEALFRSRLQKAFLSIVLAIENAQLYLVTSCEEPKEAWNALKKHFERKTLAKKLLL